MTDVFLRQREAQLVERFPDLPWFAPQPVTVLGESPVLTCRFCTALDGLEAEDLIAGRGAFADVNEHAQHMYDVHIVDPDSRTPAVGNGQSPYPIADPADTTPGLSASPGRVPSSGWPARALSLSRPRGPSGISFNRLDKNSHQSGRLDG